MDLDFLRAVRLHEIERALRWLPAGQRVLEIGAGAGWQAQWLSERGRQMVAVDVPASNYNEARMYTVVQYDGVRLPLPAASVDIIFSSNVMEHVVDLDGLLAEMRRVLKPGGYAVHLMPTTSWRVWASLGFYWLTAAALLRKLARRSAAASAESAISSTPKSRRSLVQRLKNLLIPPVHGETGNSLTELYLFNPVRWRRVFEGAGWQVESIHPNGLFYTGNFLLTWRLPFALRRVLWRVLGCPCLIYIVRPAANASRRGDPDRAG
jgi:ubiquinone/menaquinone biosynthesis C-methylase UbiE